MLQILAENDFDFNGNSLINLLLFILAICFIIWLIRFFLGRRGGL